MIEFQPRIIALHLPRFLIQRRLRDDASLAHKPVAVIRAHENTSVVVAASRQALVAGVNAGITATQAKALCPGLRLLPDDPAADLRALEGLAEALLVACPAVEIHGDEGIFADSKSSPLFGGEEGLLKVVADRCRTLGYRASVVIANGKFPAMALAVHRPRSIVGGIDQLSRVCGLTAATLAPLPLSALPAAKEMLSALASMGIKTLGEFAALPSSGISTRFGAMGVLMQRLAMGNDPRPLVPFKPAPPLVENLSLEWPAESVEPVLFALKTVLDRLTVRLSGRGLALTKLAIQLRLVGAEKTPIILPLTKPTHSSRVLLNVFRERIANFKISAPVMGVEIEALETGPAKRVQLCVGDRPEVDEALESVLAQLRAGLGEDALFSPKTVDSHRPECAWQTGPFSSDALPAPKKARERARPAQKAYLARLLQRHHQPVCPLKKVPLAQDAFWRAGTRPTRLLSHPKPLHVELSKSGRIVAVRIGNRRHVAAAIRGPERLGGEWWRASFSRDYYRTMVAGFGNCWIFRDGKDGRFYLHGYFD